MKRNLRNLQIWFDQRSTRERGLAILLSWALLYAIFYLFFFRPLDAQELVLKAQIKTEKNQINNWKIQLGALNKLENSPLFQQWQKQTKALQQLRSQSKYLYHTATIKQEDVVKIILREQNNTKIQQIKDFPETLYNPGNLFKSTTKLYQQRLSVVVLSNYVDTVNYIQRLEQSLPNVYWDNLIYKVETYPLARVELELSLLYEKNH